MIPEPPAIYYTTFGRFGRQTYDIDGEIALDCISTNIPSVVIFEHVAGIADIDLVIGTTPLQEFCKHMGNIQDPFRGGAAHFSGCHIFKRTPGKWQCLSRPRIAAHIHHRPSRSIRCSSG